MTEETYTCIGIIIAITAACILLLWLIRWWAQGGQFTNKTVRADGKVAIVTGCNTGIGKETVLELARRGAKVYMACRNQQKCELARQEIIKQTGNQNIINKQLDLASFESIRTFVKEFLAEESQLHILVNNAGVFCSERALTTDGFEMHFGTNHLGHFLLTNLLLDTLKASRPSRIINVSSAMQRFSRINRDDLNMEKSYNSLKAYGSSKLANVFFTRGLAKRLLGTGVTVNSADPGAVNTDILRNNRIMRALIMLVFNFFYKSAKSGAQTQIALALDPELEQVSNLYFVDCKPSTLLPHARDDDTAEWLWRESERMTQLNSVATIH